MLVSYHLVSIIQVITLRIVFKFKQSIKATTTNYRTGPKPWIFYFLFFIFSNLTSPNERKRWNSLLGAACLSIAIAFLLFSFLPIHHLINGSDPLRWRWMGQRIRISASAFAPNAWFSFLGSWKYMDGSNPSLNSNAASTVQIWADIIMGNSGICGPILIG